jgi:hypothetical protein
MTFFITFFGTSGFLNRQVGSSDPKIGIAMTGSFRNDFLYDFLCDFGISQSPGWFFRSKNQDRDDRLISK